MSSIKALLTQVEVVEALVLRETRTRFGAHQLGYLWAVIEPALWIATFYAMYAIAGREAPVGMDLVSFLLTGLLPYSLFSAVTNQVSQSINGNKALLFYPQVRTLDIVAARAILEGVTYAAVFFLFVLAHALFVQQWPTVDDALITIFGFALATGMGVALGLVFCSLEVLTSAAGRVRGPLLRPLFWCSGLFYTANGLPTNVRDIFLYNPMLHVIEIVRDGWFPSYQARHASAGYAITWMLCLLVLGLLLERAVRRKIEVT
jgi:capsular polysaccharide transport system permease protein